MAKTGSAIVIPNLNGKASLKKCLASLLPQLKADSIIVVDNASVDGSAQMINELFSGVQVICNSKNRGFAGGVNPGIKLAIEQGFEYVALLNNDAVAETGWLSHLSQAMDRNPKAGIVTSKIMGTDHKLDSTGEYYSRWGLPFPRGRGQKDDHQYDDHKQIFAASGGASLYRISMLKSLGLFDEDFFAYYEDVDISFRAQLAGWKVLYEPSAVVFHEIGATSSKIKGFTTYQTIKNLPFLFWKNVPAGFWPNILPRFAVAYLFIFLSALSRGQIYPAFKGLAVSLALWPKKLWQRRKIQSSRKVAISYINSLIWQDLPPGPSKLRSLRKVLSLGILK